MNELNSSTEFAEKEIKNLHIMIENYVGGNA